MNFFHPAVRFHFRVFNWFSPSLLLAGVLLIGDISRALGNDFERVVLENGFLALEFMPSLSGRVTDLRVGKSGGLIAFEPPIVPWRRPPVPEQDPSGGGTLWLAPQKAWWRHQRVDADRRRRLPPWPPDPYGERADFSVYRPDPASLVLAGPASPVSGVKLVKSIGLPKLDVIDWKWSAQNKTWGIRTWGLWPNFRVNQKTEFWVWNPANSQPQWSGREACSREALRQQGQWLVIDGSRTSQSGKISLSDWSGLAVLFLGDVAYRVETDRVSASAVAPGHYPLEIFLNAEIGKLRRRCTEFETHGPRRVLLPGATTSFRQEWLVRKLPKTPKPWEREAIAVEMLSLPKRNTAARLL
jgi:hypothetical protein